MTAEGGEANVDVLGGSVPSSTLLSKKPAPLSWNGTEQPLSSRAPH